MDDVDGGTPACNVKDEQRVTCMKCHTGERIFTITFLRINTHRPSCRCFISPRLRVCRGLTEVRLSASSTETPVKSKGSGQRAGARCVWCSFAYLLCFAVDSRGPSLCIRSSLARHDSQAAPQVRAEMKISVGGEYLDENLKQPAEWQPVQPHFLRCWTGTYYWCLLLGVTHTDELDVVNLLGATGVSNSPHGASGTHLSSMQRHPH